MYEVQFYKKNKIKSMELSFDIAIRDFFSTSAAIRQDSEGQIVEVWTSRIPNTNRTFEASLLATQMAKLLQKRPSILASDAQIFIDAITKEAPSPLWQITPITDDIHHNLHP